MRCATVLVLLLAVPALSAPPPCYFEQRCFTVNATDYALNWSWTYPSASDFDHFEVWENGTLNATTTLPFFVHAGLGPFNTRALGVRWLDANGTPSSFLNKTGTTTNILPPGAAQNISVAASGWNYLRWSWTPPGDPDIAGLDVWTDGPFNLNPVFNSSLPKNATSFNATGLAQESEHFVTIRAADNGSNYGSNATGVAVTPRCENWTTGQYGVCASNNTSHRPVADLNSCGTTEFMPEETAACTFVPPGGPVLGAATNIANFEALLRTLLAEVESLVFRNQTPNVSVSVAEERPAGVADPNETVPYYLTVAARDAIAEEAGVRFKVNESWFAGNGYDPALTVLRRFNASNGTWESANTSYLGCSAGFCSFEARVSGFSTFAPTGEAGAPAPPAPRPGGGGDFLPIPTWTPTPPPAPPVAPKGPPLQLLAGLGLLGVVSVFIIARDERAKRKRHRTRRP